MEITLLINGEERTFSKKNFTLRENLIAMKHQVKADVYYSDEEALKNPEKYEELQKDLLETISKIFDEQFTDEQLMTGLVIEKADVITDILVRAMGGNKKDDKKKEQEPITAEEAYMSIKSMIQTLLKGGYKLPEILMMKLEDLELFNEVLDNEASTSELTEDFLSLLSV